MHMIDKSHCFMNTYDLEEFIEFYDFSEAVEKTLR